ncbi:MAG TPA: imidazole glycerol phosphate synthase subunit HisH [Afipia sp.]
MITIVDYGTSNLGSMQNMLKKIGAESRIASSPAQLREATKIILPGVGSFDAGMEKLSASGMITVLNDKALTERVPVLGVCLGMQLMSAGSEEGVLPGLGWFDARTIRFDQQDEPDLKVPHMGWNEVDQVRAFPLITGLPPEARFYFAHSYFIGCKRDDMLLEARYGRGGFAAAIQKDNIMGAQFHPEKSHKFGMWFLKNFVDRF